jgi:hypothetical protein
MMDKLVNDEIPNIRFNVAKSYAILIDTLKQLPEEGTVLALQKAYVSPCYSMCLLRVGACSNQVATKVAFPSLDIA